MESLIANRQNKLLLKDDIGKPKPPIIKNLPHDFTFGRPENREQEGVAVITRSWVNHSPSRGRLPGVDFKKINKIVLNNKLDVKSLKSELKSKVHLKDKEHEIRRRENNKTISLPPEYQTEQFKYDTMFGKPTRVQTPVKNIVQFDYANSAEEEIK